MNEKIKELFRNAVFRENLEELTALTKAHPKSNLNDITYSISGYTLLHQAAQTGNVLIVKFLLEHGVNPNAEDHFGNTPLNVAALHQNGEVGAILTEADGNYENLPPTHNIVFYNQATGHWHQTNHETHQFHVEDNQFCNHLCGQHLTSGDFI